MTQKFSPATAERDALVMNNLGFAIRIGARFAPSMPLDEQTGIATVALVMAANEYASSRGLSFQTFAYKAICMAFEAELDALDDSSIEANYERVPLDSPYLTRKELVCA